MANNTIYLKIGNSDSGSDITGSVTQAGYEDCMRLESVEFGLSINEPTADVDYRGGVNMSQVKMTKTIDKASPLIAEYLTRNTGFNMQLTLLGQSVAGDEEKKVTLEFERCRFFEYQTTIELEERPIETFTVFYVKCHYNYEVDGVMTTWERVRPR